MLEVQGGIILASEEIQRGQSKMEVEPEETKK